MAVKLVICGQVGTAAPVLGNSSNKGYDMIRPVNGITVYRISRSVRRWHSPYCLCNRTASLVGSGKIWSAAARSYEYQSSSSLRNTEVLSVQDLSAAGVAELRKLTLDLTQAVVVQQGRNIFHHDGLGKERPDESNKLID